MCHFLCYLERSNPDPRYSFAIVVIVEHWVEKEGLFYVRSEPMDSENLAIGGTEMVFN